MNRFIRLCTLTAGIALATQSVALAQDAWTPYTPDQVGGGIVKEDARA